jgi:hypothetical protein
VEERNSRDRRDKSMKEREHDSLLYRVAYNDETVLIESGDNDRWVAFNQ